MQLIEEIINKTQSDGITEETIVLLKRLRPHYIEQAPDPLVTRLIRLSYQFIEKNNHYNIQFLEETEKPGEELVYLMELIKKPKHPLNREELTEIKEVLYGHGEK